jgi:LacI family transcriptional regulator
VAKAAGVSIATVSRILNSKDGVSDELVSKVQAAVKELKYQPNNFARALKIQQSRSIGLIIPDIENPYFPALVRGVQDAAQTNDYALLPCNTDGKPEEEERYIKFLLSKQVDGILFAGNLEFAQNREWLLTIPVPVVLLDRRISGMSNSAVLTDNRLGAFMAVEHLIKQGRRHIAMVGGKGKSSSSQERTSGYVAAHQAYEYPCLQSLIISGDFSFAGGYKAAQALLSNGDVFDAVFAANDMMAIGVIECLIQQGIRIPDDVAVVGYDNINMAAWCKPSLTTINQPVYDMGRIGVDILITCLNRELVEQQEVLLKPELIVRQSSGAKEEAL